MTANPVFPLNDALAVIIAVPGPAPVTRPVSLTVATVFGAADHVNAVSRLFEEVAESWRVSPAWRDAAAGVTVTVASHPARRRVAPASRRSLDALRKVIMRHPPV
jgi:hypothetical protein